MATIGANVNAEHLASETGLEQTLSEARYADSLRAMLRVLERYCQAVAEGHSVESAVANALEAVRTALDFASSALYLYEEGQSTARMHILRGSWADNTEIVEVDLRQSAIGTAITEVRPVVVNEPNRLVNQRWVEAAAVCDRLLVCPVLVSRTPIGALAFADGAQVSLVSFDVRPVESLAGAIAPAVKALNRATGMVDEARRLLVDDKPGEALERARMALSIAPGLEEARDLRAECLVQLAKALVNEGRFVEAGELLRQVPGELRTTATSRLWRSIGKGTFE